MRECHIYKTTFFSLSTITVTTTVTHTPVHSKSNPAWSSDIRCMASLNLFSPVHKALCGSPVSVLPYTFALMYPVHFLSNEVPMVFKCIMLISLPRMEFLRLYTWEIFFVCFKRSSTISSRSPSLTHWPPDLWVDTPLLDSFLMTFLPLLKMEPHFLRQVLSIIVLDYLIALARTLLQYNFE